MSALNDYKYQTAARAIYALGQNRLPEIVATPAPNQFLTCLIGRTSDKAFRSLSDVSITLLLRSESDAVRKSTALKCVRYLPRKRVAKLLDHYSSGDEYRYYNVIHWLDFGISTPRDRALPSAQKALNQAWRP